MHTALAYSERLLFNCSIQVVVLFTLQNFPKLFGTPSRIFFICDTITFVLGMSIKAIGMLLLHYLPLILLDIHF